MPPTAQLQAALAALAAMLAGIPSISAADSITLAALQQQVSTALFYARQVASYYDVALAAAGVAANFASGTAPPVMVANVTYLLAIQSAFQSSLNTFNSLSRLAINIQAIIAPKSVVVDINHTFGEDIGVTPTGDIGVVSGWLRTAQRVIRRLCTPSTKPAAQTTTLAVSPGDDLFRIAAAIYNDATAWSLIAAANGLADPMVQVDQVLTIPGYSSARVNDGILPVPGATS